MIPLKIYHSSYPYPVQIVIGPCYSGQSGIETVMMCLHSVMSAKIFDISTEFCTNIPNNQNCLCSCKLWLKWHKNLPCFPLYDQCAWAPQKMAAKIRWNTEKCILSLSLSLALWLWCNLCRSLWLKERKIKKLNSSSRVLSTSCLVSCGER